MANERKIGRKMVLEYNFIEVILGDEEVSGN